MLFKILLDQSARSNLVRNEVDFIIEGQFGKLLHKGEGLNQLLYVFVLISGQSVDRGHLT